MALIIKNKVVYGGVGGGDNSVDLTMAEYKALEAAGTVMSDTTYYITDADNDQYNASSVVFDDTNTQLGAVNVQVAIEKTNDDINELNSNMNIIDEAISKLSEDIATKASAIKEKTSGEVIVVTDSDEAKPLGLAIDGKSEQNQYSGKQLIDVSKVSKYPATGYVANDIGSLIKVSDTISRGKVYYPIDISLLTGEEVKLSAKISKSISDVAIYVGATITSPSGNTYHNLATSDLSGVKTKTFVIPSDATSMNVDINVNDTTNTLSTANTVTVENLMLCLSSVTDDTFEPFVGGKPSPSTEYQQEIINTGKYDEASGKYAVEVKCNKKNFLKNTAESKTVNGVEFVVNEDKSITLNGTASESINNYYLNQENMNLDNMIATCDGINDLSGIYFAINNGTTTFNVFGSKKEVSLNGSMSYARIYIDSGATFNNATIKPMIRPVGTDNTYEPWQESTATVLLDEPLRKGDKAYWNGGSKIRVDRYRAVEVFDGSDDEILSVQSGKLWYSEIPLNTIAKDISFLCNSYRNTGNSENYGFNAYINSQKLTVFYDSRFTDKSEVKTWLQSNPVEFEYQLETPITEEIDIDLGELSMFYPTTILSNDCNANMEVTYIADTKAYIDKKFAELATAMV